MKELDAQALVRKSVENVHGFAFKAANRFLVGVPDLFVAIRSVGTAFIECKMDSVRQRDQAVPTGVTKRQFIFMRDLDRAGQTCGFMSFVKHNNKLMLFAIPLSHLSEDMVVGIDKYVILDTALGGREGGIVDAVKKIINAGVMR